MSTHYITCAPIAILGGFVVVASQSFSSTVLGWVAFGVAVGIITIAVLAQLDRSRGGVQRILDGTIVAVASLMTGFALASSGATVIRLSFAFSLGIAALAFTGLTLHEVSTWRAEHQLGSLHWLPNAETAGSPGQQHAA
jgi:hypothetical protein